MAASSSDNLPQASNLWAAPADAMSRRMFRHRHVVPVALLFALSLRCGDDSDEQRVALRFAPLFRGVEVGCTDALSGLGSNGDTTIGMGDLRFYVSNLKMFDSTGGELAVTLDDNEFQYRDDIGAVALLDLTSNQAGTCANTAIAFAEGTARMNDRISGLVSSTPASISFDVGLPQPLMKSIISNHTAEGAPSPLAEMYWSWASGYRHLVFNFTVTTGNELGEGYLHIGSRDCGGDGARALTDRETCGLVNTPKVVIDDFDPSRDTIAVDIEALLGGLDFIAPTFDSEPPFDIIGEGPGVSCHSSPAQADCTAIFQNLGLDASTGTAQPSANGVFQKR